MWAPVPEEWRVTEYVKYLGMLTLFVALSVALDPASGEGVDSCFSALTPDMKIHVPSVKFEGAILRG